MAFFRLFQDTRLERLWHAATSQGAGIITEETMSYFSQRYGRLMSAAEFKDEILAPFAQRRRADTERWNAPYQELAALEQLFIAA